MCMGSRFRLDIARRALAMGVMAVLLAGLATRGIAAADDPGAPKEQGAAPTGDTPETLFQRGVTALRDGSLNEAVEVFEALADRGFVDPDASFDRSLSYLGRVRAGVERPGDLGRAAAALEETLLLRPDDREAESALDLVRAEVARRRARGGATTDVESRPTLERAVIGIASEWTWSILAVLSSLLLTIGLALRVIASSRDDAFGEERTAPPAREGTLHLASAIIVPLGGASLLAFALLATGARQLRLTTREGVVVMPEAHLVTEKGILTTKGPLPEAARVEIGEQRGALVHVRWGAVEGWTQSDAVRRLARP
jgi:hypothetical protein